MKKIIDFFKRLFGFTNNSQNSESKTNEIPITKYGLNGGLESNQSESKTNCQLIKNHFKEFGFIDKQEAKEKYGINKLPTYIFRLKKRGMDISYIKSKKQYVYKK